MNYPKIERPTEPGWYWLKQTPACRWVLCRVRPRGLTQPELTVDFPTGRTKRLFRVAGEWRGPIPEPTP